MQEFSREEKLIGKESIERLSNCSVAVFGLGGVGSYTAEALARAGIGNLTLIDSDTVNITNINRQLFALHSTIGKKKVEVAKERLLDINPSLKITVFDIFVTEENLPEIKFSNFDYIIDAIDTVSSKIAIAERAFKENIPLISSMGTGNKLHSDFCVSDIFETSVCPLAKVMRRELKERGIEKLKVVFSKESPIKTQNENQEDEALFELNENSKARCDNSSVFNDEYLDKNQQKNSGLNYINSESNTTQTAKRYPPASISFVPPVAGMLLAGEVVRDLLKL